MILLHSTKKPVPHGNRRKNPTRACLLQLVQEDLALFTRRDQSRPQKRAFGLGSVNRDLTVARQRRISTGLSPCFSSATTAEPSECFFLTKVRKPQDVVVMCL